MIDIAIFRKNPEIIKQVLIDRNLPDMISRVDDVTAIDLEWKSCLKEADSYRAERNKISRKIGEAKKTGQDIAPYVNETEELNKKQMFCEERLKGIEVKRSEILKIFPNFIDSSVPRGKDETGNVPIKWVGKPKVLSNYLEEFRQANKNITVEPIVVGNQPKSHADIVLEYGLADFDKASENSGSRFAYEKDEFVELDMALIMATFKKIRSKGFRAIIPPYLVRRKVEEGATDLGVFEDALYKIEGEDLYLVPTSEHPIVAMLAGETLKQEDLPYRMVGFSPCFRKEAGAHGKDTKGLFRVHQFHKIEEYSVTLPSESAKEFDFLLSNAEEVMSDLGIPYRVSFLCTGDMDKKAMKHYDIEGWFPAQGKYRELTSTGNVGEWQARRLGIKYLNSTSGKNEYPHTIYSTGVAVQRTLTCLLENNLQEDGTIKIPNSLKSYLTFDEIVPKKIK